jgi:hypothetical protein
MIDMDLASTDALIEELSRRFDHGAIIMIRVLTGDVGKGQGTGKIEKRVRYFGNHHTVMGMLQDMSLSVGLNLRDRCEESEHPEGRAS